MVALEFLKGFEDMPDPLMVVGESGTILFANQQAGNLLGYSLDELHGQSVEQLMPERFRVNHIRQRIRFTDRGLARPMGSVGGLFLLRKDGSERPVDISLIPIRRGLETLVVAIIHEATDPM